MLVQIELGDEWLAIQGRIDRRSRVMLQHILGQINHRLLRIATRAGAQSHCTLVDHDHHFEARMILSCCKPR